MATKKISIMTLRGGETPRWFDAMRVGRVKEAQAAGWSFVTIGEINGALPRGAMEVDGQVVRGDDANRDVLMKKAGA